jgi:hypothetical protein
VKITDEVYDWLQVGVEGKCLEDAVTRGEMAAKQSPITLSTRKFFAVVAELADAPA